MDRATALRKLRACLRLASSSNAHEAAAALRQAQKLMAEYGLTAADAAGVEEHGAKTRSRSRVPRWLATLARIVADAFGAQTYAGCGVGLEIKFVGVGSCAEVAAYAFLILRRQLERDMQRHVARMRKRSRRDRVATAFAIGWIHAIKDLLPKTCLSEAHGAAIAAYLATKGLTSVKTHMPDGKVDAAAERALDHGYAAGKNARLYSGVHGETPKQIEHGGPQ